MEDKISNVIIGAAIEVHQVLGGPGLLESIYESCLYHELTLRGLYVQKQVHVPVRYKDFDVRSPITIDLLVQEKVITEVKASEQIHSIREAQLLTYLRLTERKLGLLINFCQQYVNKGIRRIVNGL